MIVDENINPNRIFVRRELTPTKRHRLAAPTSHLQKSETETTTEGEDEVDGGGDTAPTPAFSDQDYERIWGTEYITSTTNIMPLPNERNQQDEPPPGLLKLKEDSINDNTVFVNPSTFLRVNPPISQQLAAATRQPGGTIQQLTAAASRLSGGNSQQQLTTAVMSARVENEQHYTTAQMLKSDAMSIPGTSSGHLMAAPSSRVAQPIVSLPGPSNVVPVSQQEAQVVVSLAGNQAQQNNTQSQHNIVYNQQQVQQSQLVYTTEGDVFNLPEMLLQQAAHQVQRGIKRQSMDSGGEDYLYLENDNSNSSYGGQEASSYQDLGQDQTSYQAASGGSGYNQQQDSYILPDNSEAADPLKLAALLDSHNFSGYEPSPSGEDISLKDYPGDHKFEVKFAKMNQKNKHWVFSTKLNKLFVDMDKWVQVEFKIGTDPPADLTIRTLPVYTEASYRREPVKRCPNHASAEEKSNRDFNFPHHIIRYQNTDTIYEEDEKSSRLFSVFPVSTPHKGTDTISRMVKFMCLGSDIGGINRRPIKVVFTLEYQGRVVGRRCIDVRVCSCPKRDQQQEEFKQNRTESDVKRITERCVRGINLESVGDKTTKIAYPHHPPSKKKKMDPPTIIMVPVHCNDFKKINEFSESAWICRDPQNQDEIKETRKKLLEKHNQEILNKLAADRQSQNPSQHQ